MQPKQDKQEIWIQTHWRPLAAVVYLAINVCDFILFPIVNGAFYYYTKTPLVQWTPLTIQGGGLFHVAFGAILGVAAWGRTQEKIYPEITQTNYQRQSTMVIKPLSDDPER
jgi:hypothetical protein